MRSVTANRDARKVALSPSHFIRVFKAFFGETPHQVHMTARLNLAKHLVLTSERSVTDICTEVGFSSLGTFSDLFASVDPRICALICRQP
jgi:transcriptional regulator GlxA family with amidase domain